MSCSINEPRIPVKKKVNVIQSDQPTDAQDTFHSPIPRSSTTLNLASYLYTYVCVVGTCTLPDMSHVTCHMSHGTGYKLYCIILRGKLKEAATGSTNPMYTMAAPVILVVSYSTTRLLSNSPAHSHSRSLMIQASCTMVQL